MKKIVATISVDRKSIPAITLISLLLTVVSVPYILWLSAIYSTQSKAPRSANLDLFVAVCIGILIVHEIIHAIVYRLYGAKPRFGAKLVAGFVPVLTTSAKGSRIKLTKMIVVGLSPFVLISIALSLLASVPNFAAYALAAFAVNFIGSAGDIYMMFALTKYRRGQDYTVEDTGTSFKLLS
jgi:hypothetical protein